MDVKLPKLGEGAESGVVVNVLVKEGDTVALGQTIIELENEKAVAPVPASAAGTVAAVRVKIGDRVGVGQTLLVLGTAAPAGAAATPPAAPVNERRVTPASAPAAAAPAGSVQPALPDAAPAELGEAVPLRPGVHAPPAAPSLRRIARELGIDLNRVRGSEQGGRIVMSDLRAYVQRLEQLAARPKPTAASPSAAAAAPEPVDFSQWGTVTKRPLTPLRQTIGRRMSENWNQIPHVTQFEEIDITALTELRKKHAPAYETKGVRLTLTTFALKAVVTALKMHPIFNASLDEVGHQIVFKEYYHVGLAVDTEHGLLVPVIRDVDKKSLFQLSKEVGELAEKARERKVSLDEMRGGTFTISNQGGIGGSFFTPIVNKPEVAILGLGRGVLKPVVRESRIEPRLLMPVGISYDHRVIDGGTAARFTVDLAAAFAAFADADLKL